MTDVSPTQWYVSVKIPLLNINSIAATGPSLEATLASLYLKLSVRSEETKASISVLADLMEELRNGQDEF